MKKLIRFLHTADIHLGSPLKNIERVSDSTVSDSAAGILKNAGYMALERICDAALANEVDFVVVSGDVYDLESRSVRANQFLVRQFERLAEKSIPVFVIYGNHDPLGEGGEFFELPGNVRVFGCEEAEVHEMRNQSGELIARVIGQSYRGRSDSRKMPGSYTAPDSAVWNIALLHTALEPTNNNYVPCSREDLTGQTHIDYWALGHIHKPDILRSERPIIAYPGIPQGRDPGELGLHGCLLVELDPHEDHSIRFIPTSPVVWQEITVPIDGRSGAGAGSEPGGDCPGNLAELEELMAGYAADLAAGAGVPDNVLGYMVRWVLVGRGPVHEILVEQAEEAVEVLAGNLRRRFSGGRPFVWTESIQIRTGKPLPDLEVLRASNEVLRAVDEIINALRTDPDQRKRLIRAFGAVWEDTGDHENFDPQKFQITGEIIDTVLEQAGERILERILERRRER